MRFCQNINGPGKNHILEFVARLRLRVVVNTISLLYS